MVTLSGCLTLNFHQILLNGGHTGSTRHSGYSQEALLQVIVNPGPTLSVGHRPSVRLHLYAGGGRRGRFGWTILLGLYNLYFWII